MIKRRYTAVGTPFGLLYLTLDGELITRIDTARPTIADALRFDDHPVLQAAKQAVKDYLDGNSRALDLPHEEHFSPFQAALYKEVLAIPYGTTCTIEELSKRLKKPHAAQAMEVMCRCNPLWIIIPTHRVLLTAPPHTPHITPQESLRRMEQRYAARTLDKAAEKA